MRLRDFINERQTVKRELLIGREIEVLDQKALILGLQTRDEEIDGVWEEVTKLYLLHEEVLEEDEFEPMFVSCEPKLENKKIALFGSYGWGDGEWMRDWEETCGKDGAVLACDCVICNETPDDEANAACIALGKALA